MAKDVGVKTAIAGIASEYVEFLPLGILPKTISGQFIKIEVTEIRDTLAQNETLTSGVERRPIQRRILPSRGPYAADRRYVRHNNHESHLTTYIGTNQYAIENK